MTLHPVEEDGKCSLCQRRHHPGWGCPRWRKMSEENRRKVLDRMPCTPHS